MAGEGFTIERGSQVILGPDGRPLAKLGNVSYTVLTDRGLILLGVRRDAGTSLADADGKLAPFTLDSAGRLRVGLDQAGAGTLTSKTETTDAVTPVQLNAGVSLACRGVLVQADPDNANDVLVGDSDSRDVQLGPGATEWLPVANVTQVYWISASGTMRVNWHAFSVS